jgi:hypothetical protein
VQVLMALLVSADDRHTHAARFKRLAFVLLVKLQQGLELTQPRQYRGSVSGNAPPALKFDAWVTATTSFNNSVLWCGHRTGCHLPGMRTQ